MKTVTDFEAVLAEMRSRGLPINDKQNCNLAGCEDRRELFYFQLNPKLAVWAIYEEDEMEGFYAFIQQVIENGQKPNPDLKNAFPITDGQHRTRIK